MIAWFTTAGKPNPVKFKFASDGDDCIIIRVGRIITVEEEKIAGNRMYLYKCQSVVDNTEKIYELKYEIASCKWFLYKM
ncbi:hypothetical protein CLHUN_02510 [Ruminiclostridium hungatei]|uniref:Uncharacterized protein n=2 Tax=Ruminiclostridium hungatei TaxID=48256 RepID=A0A1V4SSK8_RUMHU|nr:hypothetical protein CLHUN_02510 [Ruminiclostridium hungatei]